MNNLRNFGIKSLYGQDALKSIHNFDDVMNRKPKAVLDKKKLLVRHNQQIDFYERNGTLKAKENSNARSGIRC
jgi:hypothetical protein